jgi:hypothetical protein
MQYFIGFIFGFILLYSVIKLQAKYNIFNNFSSRQLKQSQSNRHYLLFLFNLYEETKKPPKKTQSRLHEEKTNIKVIIMEDQAYWIKDNVFYTANISGGNVDQDTTRVVDTMTMNKVQLDQMMFIIDRLREGILDDSGGAGN